MGFFIHILVSNQDIDYDEKIDCAQIIARSEYTSVFILPEIYPNQYRFRFVVFPNNMAPETHPNANPDFLIDGEFWDLKCPRNNKNIVMNINKCNLAQNAFCIIMDKYIKIGDSEISFIQRRGFATNYSKSKIKLIANNEVTHIKKGA
jgi:hypothetical protein